MTAGRKRRAARRGTELRRGLIWLASVCAAFRLMYGLGLDTRLEKAAETLSSKPEFTALLLELGFGPAVSVEETVPISEGIEPDETEESTIAVTADTVSEAISVTEVDIQPDSTEKSSVTEYYREELVTLKNNTNYGLNVPELLNAELPFSEDCTVLILHTHGSEAYTPTDNTAYTESDPGRTEDAEFNVIRVGEELTAQLESRGINVIHDRTLYDYPSYAGSYSRSLEAAESLMAEHPEIEIVIDLHRDAMDNDDGSPYTTFYSSPLGRSAQVMLVMGTGEDGLEHPNWRQNMSFAVKVQAAMNGMYSGLARPLSVRGERFNQQLCGGTLLAEIGLYGNTLDEALLAARFFGDALAEVILSAEQP